MLNLDKPTCTNTISYDEAVIQGKKIMSEIEGKQWELGDLANSIEPRYGRHTIRHLAEDIGIKEMTIQRCRSVARAWPENKRRRLNSFEVAKALIANPNRFEIVDDNHHLTQRQARELTRSVSRPKKVPEEVILREHPEEVVFPYQEPCTDCNSAEEQWQRSLGNMLGDILSFRAYWDHLFGKDWMKFRIPSSHLKLATEAEREFKILVALLKEHDLDTQN